VFSGPFLCLLYRRPKARRYQLRPVMALPHLGQSDPLPERQVVPQWEQVLAVAAQAFRLVLTQPQE